EHEALEGEGHDARALGEHASRGREEVRDRDAQRLLEDGEELHAPSPATRAPTAFAGRARTALRSRRRTSGAVAAIARITTAWSLSTSCFGTAAWMASPPCDRVAKSSEARSTPSG